MVTPIAATATDGIPLFKQINIPWYPVCYWSGKKKKNFLVTVNKVQQWQFIWQGQENTFHCPTSEVRMYQFSSPMS